MGSLARPPPEHVLVAPVARPDHDHLQPQVQELRHRLLHQVEAFDVVEPRHDRADRLVHVIQAELRPEVRPAQRLPLRSVRGIVGL